jgi:hypothetical protein
MGVLVLGRTLEYIRALLVVSRNDFSSFLSNKLRKRKYMTEHYELCLWH